MIYPSVTDSTHLSFYAYCPNEYAEYAGMNKTSVVLQTYTYLCEFIFRCASTHVGSYLSPTLRRLFSIMKSIKIPPFPLLQVLRLTRIDEAAMYSEYYELSLEGCSHFG